MSDEGNEISGDFWMPAFIDAIVDFINLVRNLTEPLREAG